jgi:hypothetical protein
MPWNFGVSERVSTKDFVATDVLVGVTMIFVVLSCPIFRILLFSGGRANGGSSVVGLAVGPAVA